MKINSELGYEPVTYSELTDDEMFWKGCESCVNFEILKSKERKNCLCTAMLFDPATIALGDQLAIAYSNRAIAVEFSMLQHELQMLPDRHQAILNLGLRSGAVVKPVAREKAE